MSEPVQPTEDQLKEIAAAEEQAQKARAEAAARRQLAEEKRRADAIAQFKDRQRQMLQSLAAVVASGTITRFPARHAPAEIAQYSLQVALHIIGQVENILNMPPPATEQKPEQPAATEGDPANAE